MLFILLLGHSDLLSYKLRVVDNLILEHVGLPQVVIVTVHLVIFAFPIPISHPHPQSQSPIPVPGPVA